MRKDSTAETLKKMLETNIYIFKENIKLILMSVGGINS